MIAYVYLASGETDRPNAVLEDRVRCFSDERGFCWGSFSAPLPLRESLEENPRFLLVLHHRGSYGEYWDVVRVSASRLCRNEEEVGWRCDRLPAVFTARDDVDESLERELDLLRDESALDLRVRQQSYAEWLMAHGNMMAADGVLSR